VRAVIHVFEGFSAAEVNANETMIHVTHGGDGPPVLLLHGYPQTHAMWHRVAPALAERFTVICPDLRGYGDSAKPPSDATHAAYSKRVMAQDQLEVMRELGFERFAVVGHDRGARVARRLALDHPGSVSRLALLDIVPTATIYASLDRERATTVWRYFFLIQPPDLPERLIGSDPDFYLRWTFDEWCEHPDALAEQALAEYRRCFDRATIHATCEDYRAGATIDLAHDRDDAGRRISCPVLVLWSRGGLGSSYDVPGIWRSEVGTLHGRAIDCGHFVAEERPDETAAELVAFLADVPSP
jgi:haloacetate dehalogenase